MAHKHTEYVTEHTRTCHREHVESETLYMYVALCQYLDQALPSSFLRIPPDITSSEPVIISA